MFKKKLVVLSVVTVMASMLAGCSLTDLKKQGQTDGKINIEKDDSKKDDGKNGATDSSTNEEKLWEDEAVEAKIDEVNAYIDNYYYFDVDKEKQEEALFDGIMGGLDDPYSVYYTEEEYADLQEDTSGEYVGVGAVVTQDMETKLISIVRPIEGSPAEEAGLMAGDILISVDDLEVTDLELDFVVDRIRGEEGTTAHIVVYREGEEDYLEFDVTRRVVENVNVHVSILDSGVGYIQIDQFYQNTVQEFADALDLMEASKVKGVVIDLRDNPGGLLTAVSDMCNYILDGGVIVYTEDKNGNRLSEYKADSKHSVDMPMVVLVNGNSASASEIFAGCMQDTGKATLVGTQTFGKGIVQSVIPLSDGTAIKITIAKYFTPNGNDIHKVGITPDKIVELPDGRTNAVNIPYEDDTQLQEAEKILGAK